MDKLRVGIIGVGYLGTQHARILSYLEKVDFKGVADIDSNKSMVIGNRHRVPYYENFEDMLDEIDAGIVAAPTSEHYSIAERLLKEGKSVLLEKPMTDTVEQAEMLVDLAKKKGLILQIGHLERFNPAVEALKDIIKEPKFIEVQRLGSFSARSFNHFGIFLPTIHTFASGIVFSMCGQTSFISSSVASWFCIHSKLVTPYRIRGGLFL